MHSLPFFPFFQKERICLNKERKKKERIG